MEKLKFINLIKEGALRGKAKNVLPSLTMAQAIVESGWGDNAPGYNMFGIKWSKNCGHGYQLLWTKEWDGEKYISIKARFRKYNNYTESIEDHTELLQASRYKPVRNARDYKEACKQIKQCGYATSPTYTENLIKVIEQNKLYNYDKEEEFDLFKYVLFPVARGRMTKDSQLECCSRPSGLAHTGHFIKKEYEPFNVFAICHAENHVWMLVNYITEQWVVGDNVKLEVI